MEKIKETIKNKKILALIGVIGNILGMILPFYTISFFGYTSSSSIIDYWVGVVLLIFVILCGIVIFSDVIKTKLPQVFNNQIGKTIEKFNNPKFAFVPSGAVVLYLIYLISKTSDFLDYFNFGIGFYLLLLGILGFIGHAIFYKGNNNIQTQNAINNQNIPNNIPQQTNTFNNSTPQVENNNVQFNNLNQNTQNFEKEQVQSTNNFQPKFCPNCGTKLNENTTLCTNCGKQF